MTIVYALLHAIVKEYDWQKHVAYMIVDALVIAFVVWVASQ